MDGDLGSYLNSGPHVNPGGQVNSGIHVNSAYHVNPGRHVNSNATAGRRISEAGDDVLRLRIEQFGAGVVVITLTGEVDSFTSPRLDRVVAQQCAACPTKLVLDLTAVTFLGSTGLASLIRAQDAARARGAVWCLVARARVVLRPMELTGLTEQFEIYPDLDSALDC